jgi:hypothetical protein
MILSGVMLQGGCILCSRRGHSHIITVFDTRFLSIEWTRASTALDLLRGPVREGPVMTKTNWLLLGAVIIGLLVVVYLVFLCPSDCH